MQLNLTLASAGLQAGVFLLLSQPFPIRRSARVLIAALLQHCCSAAAAPGRGLPLPQRLRSSSNKTPVGGGEGCRVVYEQLFGCERELKLIQNIFPKISIIF
jgi:hypothetical protein